jgi:hypothetical protein
MNIPINPIIIHNILKDEQLILCNCPK